MSEEWLGQLIEGAYDAAVEGNWDEWLDTFRRALAGDSAILAPVSQYADALRMVPIASGQQHFDHHDLSFYLQNKDSDPFFVEMMQQPNRPVVMDEAWRSRRTASELGEFLSPLQSRYHHGVGTITGGPGGKVVLGLFRGQQQPAFEPKLLRDMERLFEHFSRALALVPFIEERVEHRLQQAKLELHDGPVAVVRANNTPVFINGAMASYLEQGTNPIRFDHGRLVAEQPLVQRLLERAQLKACNGSCNARLPLGDEQVTILPLPDDIYPNATLWQIG